ncbi:unnamed protein product [Sphagnum jensenii]|uniref:Uncharacterized protein n=1 Tax=Sphagnum jensenii TaxID=128206 RepID=A0ABP1BT02_9BRYO
MDQEAGSQPRDYRQSTISQRTLRRVTPSLAERLRSIPRLGDIWVPKSAPIANHFPKLYIPGVEDLFQIGDRIIRVEHGGSRSRLICWRIWRDARESWQFQQESSDEQIFSLIPFDFSPLPLRPVAEGEQSTFFG